MRFEVLDHGYCELVDSWGSDERIIEAARMSTQGGFVSWDPYEGHPKGDAGLLRYLWANKHLTPFEMAGMIIEVQAPIFVFREWMRHRTQSYNEMSARYSPLPDLNYVPTLKRCVMTGGPNKQSQSVGGQVLDIEESEWFVGELQHRYRMAQELYEQALQRGVPKELARLVLPVGRYSRMRASANLRNWLAFLTLRTDQAAQFEIREYASAVAAFVQKMFPRTFSLWAEGYRAFPLPQSGGTASPSQ